MLGSSSSAIELFMVVLGSVHAEERSSIGQQKPAHGVIKLLLTRYTHMQYKNVIRKESGDQTLTPQKFLT